MNPIAKEARRALTAPGYPTKNGLCQQFARMVCEAALGGKPMGMPNPSSAAVAGRRLLAQGHAFASPAVAMHGGLQPGDILYKVVGSGGNGHVGIYLGNNQVAENSSYHWNRNGGKDARGIRSLEAFGAFQIVARFAAPKEATVAPAKPVLAPVPAVRPLYLDIGEKSVQVDDAALKGGHYTAEVKEMLIVLGFDYGPSSKTTPGEYHLKVWKK